MRPTFSISRLMALIRLIAVGLAAMAGAFTFAIVTLSATTVGTLLSKGSSRAFFLECTVFGWAAMLLAFGEGPGVRAALPTTRPIIRIYEAINGPSPVTFKSPDEAQLWVMQVIQSVNRAVTVGHSLISLFLALVGGVLMWLNANRRTSRAERSESPSPVGGPFGQGG